MQIIGELVASIWREMGDQWSFADAGNREYMAMENMYYY